jgi:hypothetical protein
VVAPHCGDKIRTMNYESGVWLCRLFKYISSLENAGGVTHEMSEDWIHCYTKYDQYV